jgi:hypothetical protein
MNKVFSSVLEPQLQGANTFGCSQNQSTDKVLAPAPASGSASGSVQKKKSDTLIFLYHENITHIYIFIIINC